MDIIIPGLCVGRGKLEESRHLPPHSSSHPNLGIQKNHPLEMHCFPLIYKRANDNNQI